MSDDYDDRDPFDEFDDDFGDFGEDDLPDDVPLLDARESAMVQQDLVDLDQFEAAFGAEGYRGVAVFCDDCQEEHYYPWEMLRENLQMLLDTGETPVHEPAYEPDPHEYIPWQYARGYVDALRDAGVQQRRSLEACPRCQLELTGGNGEANFCPRCGAPLLVDRLARTLAEHGLDEEEITTVLREAGLPG